MKREVIKEAASVDEAKALIAEELQTAAEAITFEVLREPEKRVLGLFGGTDAMVKGTVEVAGGSEAAAQAAKAFLTDVLRQMGVEEFTCSVKAEENGCIISLDGEHLGFIIGRRGDTLDALQYLAGLVANRVDNSYYRVTLDIGNYREKREQALVGLAKRLANQTARSGRRHSLEPMNPYERRIIHTAVQEVEGAISWSVGTEPNRHVVIGPSDDNPNKDCGDEARSSRRGGRGGRNRNRNRGEGGSNRGERRNDRDYEIVAPERPVRQFISRSNPLPMADGATPPMRTESEKENDATLYGRIDL